MALWDALVFPVALGNPSGTLTINTVHGLEAKSLQGVGLGNPLFLKEPVQQLWRDVPATYYTGHILKLFHRFNITD